MLKTSIFWVSGRHINSEDTLTRKSTISTTSASTRLMISKTSPEENLQRRSNEAEKAEELVRVEAETFVRWMESLEQVPTITALR